MAPTNGKLVHSTSIPLPSAHQRYVPCRSEFLRPVGDYGTRFRSPCELFNPCYDADDADDADALYTVNFFFTFLTFEQR